MWVTSESEKPERVVIDSAVKFCLCHVAVCADMLVLCYYFREWDVIFHQFRGSQYEDTTKEGDEGNSSPSGFRQQRLYAAGIRVPYCVISHGCRQEMLIFDAMIHHLTPVKIRMWYIWLGDACCSFFAPAVSGRWNDSSQRRQLRQNGARWKWEQCHFIYLQEKYTQLRWMAAAGSWQ